jgi:hypothetical protein
VVIARANAIPFYIIQFMILGSHAHEGRAIGPAIFDQQFIPLRLFSKNCDWKNSFRIFGEILPLATKVWHRF